MEKTNKSLLQLVFERVNPFWLNLFYFISVSFLGSLLLLALPMKDPSAPRPAFFDLFFMSVSANTGSSMVSVEMESFSNSQLIVFTPLMLLGGEVFVSMLGLAFHNFDDYRNRSPARREPELGTPAIGHQSVDGVEIDREIESLEQSSSKFLIYVVLGYLVLVHAAGSVLILAYLSLFPGPMAVLRRRGIRAKTFAVFAVVSSFSNCGFIPTNENMVVFRACSGVLLTVAALVLLGNTMYPLGLRSAVWALKTATTRKEFDFILSSSDGRRRLGYGHHLMRRAEVRMLGVTVGGFVAVQALLFGCMEWRSEGLDGMNGYQKAVGSLFMAVNSRHSGESIVDLSAVSPAVLVLFVVMMYLPPYTTFFPMKGEENGERKKEKKSWVENLIMSQLSHLSILVIVVCITERKRLSEDPLNFNVLNIAFEVVSAYGNVGFTTGYSCKRRLNLDGECRDSWVGFSGRWSRKGKLTLIVVMIFGRLKKFNMKGGKAWMIR